MAGEQERKIREVIECLLPRVTKPWKVDVASKSYVANEYEVHAVNGIFHFLFDVKDEFVNDFSDEDLLNPNYEIWFKCVPEIKKNG